MLERTEDASIRSAATLTLILAAAACAQGLQPAGDSRVRAAPTTVRVTDNTGAVHGDMTYYFDDNVVVSDVSAAPNDVWLHVLTGYEALGLAPDVQDPASRTVGVRQMSMRRTLGGRPLSTYLNCGRDMTGDLANRATVRLRMLTRLVSSPGGGTQIRTELTANATDNDGTSREVRPCSSNHRLEMGLAQHVAEALHPD